MRGKFAILCAVGLALCLGASSLLAAAPEADVQWSELARDIFKGRPLNDGTGLLSIEMPYRAEDAAIVPVTLRTALPTGDTRSVKTITLVIDQNPSPVAATFTIDPGVSMISTRVRVNSYTKVHAVAELSDGALYVVETYVKASGGCSAPATRDTQQAKVTLGLMRFRQFAAPKQAPASTTREAQIMIRHPNNSGLQMDQITHLYVPLFIVDRLRVWQGDRLLLAVEGGISISEDPNIRFAYRPNGAAAFRAEASDTEGHVFRAEWPAERSDM
jgi:sulfur-oxidizing protein SoxY